MICDFTIYKTSYHYTTDEIEDMTIEYKEAYPDHTEQQIEQYLYETIDTYYFNDAKELLDKQLDGRIIAIADIGRWNGRYNGYKILGNNLNEILYVGNADDLYVCCCEKNVKATLSDHDGSTHIIYRMLKEETNVDSLLDAIYNNKEISTHRLGYYTKSLYPLIKKIYGF